jgi:tRNA (guanine-N7-)-methyltransferase
VYKKIKIKMSRNKLQKFAELMACPNVYENRTHDNEKPTLQQDGVFYEMKGQWNVLHFKNNQPIILELACGRGEYTLGLARMFPDCNFIGVDIKGARIHQGAAIALEEGLQNAAFLRTRIEQIEAFFALEEVSEIWITFPDPFLRESKENRRLTSPAFLERYRRFLKTNGLVQLKTDSTVLYDFTLETIQNDAKCQLLYENDDIYARYLDFPALSLKTYYEKRHLAANQTIKYIQFHI